ncbi:hypothetical protein MPC4_160025 [Methylocella tundrae]|uniref:Uncharacterized protein n=1 Tax=Methylocella tundrae TaxID=227605 RepID=A0A8B6M3P0_METTU|nr:hypothetical protein MPC1_990004 [Methylocella tundrae]VTZ49375.1 hypothetical protein MPC4_160025 [Methylocella tundrae]
MQHLPVHLAHWILLVLSLVAIFGAVAESQGCPYSDLFCRSSSRESVDAVEGEFGHGRAPALCRPASGGRGDERCLRGVRHFTQDRLQNL